MRPGLDFWFDFASTYSYPAAMTIAGRAEAAGVAVRWRPFLLGPIFRAQGWETSPFNVFPAKGRYMWRDMERICDGLGLPFRPGPGGGFPRHSVLAARVGLVGLREGWGEDYARAVFAAEFGEGRDIADPEVLAASVAVAGGNPEAALARATQPEIKARLRAETEEAATLGLFGAPTFMVSGEMFWGFDRLDAALAWAADRQGSA